MNTPPVVTNFIDLLKTAPTDPAVGIRIVKVTGDDRTGLYVAELGPYCSVTAHYHRNGIEIYQIVRGEGTMHTGVFSTGNTVIWNRSVNLKGGDCFVYRKDRSTSWKIPVGNPLSHALSARLPIQAMTGLL